MSNPSHLLFDSDALIQLFMCRQTPILARLRDRCLIQPAVVPEVEQEVRHHPKFRALYQPNIYSCVQAKTLTILDEAELKRTFVGRGLGAEVASAQVQTIRTRSRDFDLHVDQGEAYTHATAVGLACPVVSNDNSALKVLLAHGKQPACPTLRFFDVLVLAHKAGWIDAAAGEAARQTLASKNEFLPIPFRAKDSFPSGCHAFDWRISETAIAACGTPYGLIHIATS